MPGINDRKLAAYHEAGHVVIAWYYNIHTVAVSIVKDRHTNGESHLLSHFRRLPDLQLHQLERELDVNMAGVAAEEKLTGEKMSGTRFISESSPQSNNSTDPCEAHKIFYLSLNSTLTY